MEHAPFLRVLAGPTASGKSSLALCVAERLGAEILSADSQQVYRYFDLATAKPPADQLARVPHHLISVVDPKETFSAAQFQRLADQAILDISSRGKLVLVVGGTGLYLRALLHGIAKMPGADLLLRDRLEDEGKRRGLNALYERLLAVDPQTAASVKPKDRVRIIRALEIFEQTGRPPSSFRGEHRFAEDRYPFSMVVLSPPRDELYLRINQRTRAMFEGGLLEEVRSLVQRGFKDTAPMRSVGYVQALAVVEGRMEPLAAIEAAAKETRRYAKRQLTWFRREKGAKFFWPVDADFLSKHWEVSYLAS